MSSAFPGMDPFLEAESLWPWFQHQLVITLQRLLSTGLDGRYSVRGGERRYGVGPDEHREEYLVIHGPAGERPVTLLDIVSPANKLTDAGRTAYLDTRRAAREAGASVAEIDLILRGEPTLTYSRDGLPAWDYAVTVTRATHPDRYEIYTSSLERRLPRFKVPLAADDRDVVLDLQATFRSAYDACGFGDRIDYGSEPGVSLSPSVRDRMAEVLRERTAQGGVPLVGSAD